MATDFIMPVLSEPHHHKGPLFQHHEFRQQPQPQQYQQQPPGMSSDSQQISPLNTSSNGSPTATSPMSHHAQRTRPMYMPAVLRPNKYSSKAAQPKPDSEGSSPTPSNNSSFLALSGLGALSKITRRHTNDSAKCLPDDDDDDELNLDAFPRPTAAPTREHWKLDTEAAICDEPACMRHFNYWTRRHHCRKCGNIFCDSHSNFDVPLDQDANYNPRGTTSRACLHCFSGFKAWRSRTNSQASSEESSVIHGHSPNTAPSSPIFAIPVSMKGGPTPKARPEIAMSVPRDWNWSTF
ncbi:FYVE zinc finger domain-containing protein [Microdochium nivale]|nr:FYVE zinc finger domain-containing protein [Microdochium nivale]